MHYAHPHACQCLHANLTVPYCKHLSNTSTSEVKKDILIFGKVIAVLIEFLDSRTSRASTCIHVHEKKDQFPTSTQPSSQTMGLSS